MLADPKVSLFRPFRDTRFSEDKTPLKTHIARDVSEPRARPHERRRVLFRGRAGLGVDRRRAVAARHVAAATGARAHRRQPVASSRRSSSRRASRRSAACRATADARAARLRQGSSGRRRTCSIASSWASARSRRRSPRRRISTSSCGTRCRRSRRWCGFSTSRSSRAQRPESPARTSLDE